MTAPVELQVRPRRIVRFATAATVLIVTAMVTVGILLRNSDDGVSFRVADQIGLIGIGLLMGGLIMVVAARPRLRVDSDGLQVRNMVGQRDIPWQLIHRITIPEGAQWPVLVLADDETYPVIAIQAMDRRRAVESMLRLRALFDRFAANRPTPTPEALRSRDAELRRQESERPLGRLELIDLRRARKPR